MEALKQQERGQIKLLLGGWQGVRPPRTRRSPGPVRCGKALRTETSLSPLHSQKGWDPGMARDGPGIKPMAFYRPPPFAGPVSRGGRGRLQGQGCQLPRSGPGCQGEGPSPTWRGSGCCGPLGSGQGWARGQGQPAGKKWAAGTGRGSTCSCTRRRPPARLPAGVDAPTSRPGLGSCICWAIASCVSPAQLQFCLLQEALRALQGRAAMSSDESAPQMTRVLSLSRTT